MDETIAQAPTVEQVTQDVITETPATDVVEENNNSEIVTKNVPDEITTEEVVETEKPTTPVLTQEQLEAKLREYEVKEQEALELRNRLGIEDDSNFYLDSVEASIDNQAQQKWIKLCNTFGVDYTPNGVDKTSEELLNKDPKAYYQWKAEGEKLFQEVQSGKSQIREARISQGVGEFVNQNRAILEASPVVNQLVGNFIKENYNTMTNPQQQLSSLMEAITMIYGEALEMGKQASKVDSIKNDRTGVSSASSIATANTSGYDMATDKVFTREQIRNMSTAEFDKNAHIIERLYKEGKIN